MRLFALCLLFAGAATPTLAESTMPAGSYTDPYQGVEAHHIILPNQPSTKPDATDQALKGAPQVTYPNNGTQFSKPPAPTPEPKEKAGPEIV